MATRDLTRIADALDRIAPPRPPAADPLAHPAYLWDGAALIAARAHRALPIALLTGVDAQKAALVDNLRRLAAGAAAHDALLWGARGTGKSALAAAACAEAGVAVVGVTDGALAALPRLFAVLAGVARPFAVFLDDIALDTAGAARPLRSLLDGGAEARPDRVRLIVTSNRRHIVARPVDDGSASVRDAADDVLALADRFGLSLGFHVVDQPGYLAIVAAHAAAQGLAFDADDAVRWATQRGNRSGRTAWHYVVEIAGRAGRALVR